MAKNLLGKGRKTDNPYAVFKGNGPFGETEMRLLKTLCILSNTVLLRMRMISYWLSYSANGTKLN